MHRAIPAAALTLSPAWLPAQIQYPATAKVEHTDIYHGVKVADPYRWLEDADSPETAAWVKAENAVTNAYFSAIPYREELRNRLRQLYDYPKYGIPVRRGEYYFYEVNSGLQNQGVRYMQKGLDGEAVELLDPNKLSPDGTTRLDSFVVSKNGRYVALALAEGGSDWKTVKVLDVATRTMLPDELKWVKVSELAWAGDGFFYSRYPRPEGENILSAKNENHQVFFHRVGTQQSQDQLIFEDPAHPQRFHIVTTTEDERYAVLSVSDRGLGKDGNALYYKDLSSGAGTESKFLPIVGEITNDSYELLDDDGGEFLVRTNAKAPNWKVAAFSIATGKWRDVLPEKPESLRGAAVAGGKIFASYLKDVATRVYRYSLAGKLETEISLPGLGNAEGFGGNHDDTSIFYTYSSFDYAPTVFRYEIAANRSLVFRAPKIPGFDPARYETRQVFATSKDGTRVPMFLVHRRGLKLDGKNPTLIYGYGGFNIAINPSFNSMRLALLEQGFIYASVNMRGGSEYGEKWHQGGMKLNKQNVFDDFIAAAEWLIAHKYTSPAHLACQGGSNGGLLVGAVINQRPDLFRAAVPQVGVMDMLRFHKFTIGWNWIADYGSSDNPEEFKALYAYSPLHNIRANVTYPAVLVTTADHDDRVVPAHSFKYIATLQAKAAKTHPALIRIDTMSGHGASNTEKSIALTADIYTFLFHELGVTPSFPKSPSAE
ncbi:MAG: prolyl oligopeptidase family serine peptidase [Bryobacterales bacterium]|nr:prolyl oligopeptidase family serine peptidase [Bryobacterales bacterium]